MKIASTTVAALALGMAQGQTQVPPRVAKMKAGGCDLVVQGSSAAHTGLIPKLGGQPMDGLYVTMTAQHLTWTRPRSRCDSERTSTRQRS